MMPSTDHGDDFARDTEMKVAADPTAQRFSST
jgi:hypothetical protein